MWMRCAASPSQGRSELTRTDCDEAGHRSRSGLVDELHPCLPVRAPARSVRLSWSFGRRWAEAERWNRRSRARVASMNPRTLSPLRHDDRHERATSRASPPARAAGAARPRGHAPPTLRLHAVAAHLLGRLPAPLPDDLSRPPAPARPGRPGRTTASVPACTTRLPVGGGCRDRQRTVDCGGAAARRRAGRQRDFATRLSRAPGSSAAARWSGATSQPSTPVANRWASSARSPRAPSRLALSGRLDRLDDAAVSWSSSTTRPDAAR